MNSKLQDGLNFFSKLTFRKLFNATKILSSYYLSKLTRRHYHWGLPISIALEPTTHCNLRCLECPSGLRAFTRPTGMLEKDIFEKTINELYKDLTYLIFYFQGEPYLHPKFLEYVRFASDKGIYTATSTNGHFLNDEKAKTTIESGLDRLIISIDGTTQNAYESYRVGGQLNKVLDGTRNIIKWKKKLNSGTPHVIFQFLVVKTNEHQIKDVKKLGKELGVDEVRFKTAQIYDYKNGNPLIPSIDKFSRYEKHIDNTYKLKNKLMNHCWKLWHSSVITWDGKVVPCCFDKDAKHKLGDIKEKPLAQLWKNGLYSGFRSSILKSRSHNEMCRNCTEGTKVWENF